MKEIQIFSLLGFAVPAVLYDLKDGRIPNAIAAVGLACGFVYQICVCGIAGLLLFGGGLLLPIFIFGLFYYFRMIGAGDIKLMCTAGGFLGPSGCFKCITAAIISGAVISLYLMLRHHSFVQRLRYFYCYAEKYSKDRLWRPYLADVTEQDRFSFTLPILLGILYYIGGII